MSVKPSLWCVVPAAGIGQRMQADCPKQYLPLGDSTIIEHTLATLLSLEQVQGVVIALHPNDRFWSTLPIANHPKIHTVIGGTERADSVLAALDYLQRQAHTSDVTWVLVHDAARPCTTIGLIDKLVAELIDDAVGGILAIPSSDTLKQVSLSGEVISTLDRSQVWQAQTPQMFRLGLLHQALFASSDDKTITDEASAIEKQGCCVKVVEGARSNIKITLPDDLCLAEAIIQQCINQ